MSNLFVWDFHGVLEEGNERAVLDNSNNVLESLGYGERFSEEDIASLYGKKWREYFEYLLPGREEEEYLHLEKSCVEYGLNHKEVIYKYISPTPHSYEVLEKILETGHSQILISNCGDTSLRAFIDSVQIRSYFPNGNSFAANNGDGRSKKNILDDYLKGKEFDKVITIGDSPGDIEIVSHLPNGVSFLYSHPGKTFRDCDPDYKIKDLRNVLRET